MSLVLFLLYLIRQRGGMNTPKYSDFLAAHTFGDSLLLIQQNLNNIKIKI